MKAKLKPLSELCVLNMGQSPSSDSYNQECEGIPFYQGNSDFGELHPTVRYWCNSPTKIANKGDILISVRAPIGALNIATERCCIGRGLAALSAKDGVCDTHYILYALRSRVDELNTNGTGSTFKAISKSILGNTQIPEPGYVEQRKIAAKLDKTIELISLRRQQLIYLDTLVKSRFVEMFGDEQFEKKSVQTVCQNIFGGGTPSKSKPEYYIGEIPWVTPKDMKSSMISDSIDHITEEAIISSAAKIVPKDSVLMVIRSGVLKHTLPVAINTVPVTVNQDMKAFVVGKEVIPEYLLFTFLMREAEILSNVRVVTADNIEFSVIKNLPIPLPPLPLQQRFADFVRAADKSKFEIQQGLKTLELQYNALMQKYFG